MRVDLLLVLVLILVVIRELLFGGYRCRSSVLDVGLQSLVLIRHLLLDLVVVLLLAILQSLVVQLLLVILLGGNLFLLLQFTDHLCGTDLQVLLEESPQMGRVLSGSGYFKHDHGHLLLRLMSGLMSCRLMTRRLSREAHKVL